MIKELIKEAEERYPIGTKFKPAHITNDDTIYTVTGNWRANGNDSVMVDIKEREVWTPLVFYSSESKWAPITLLGEIKPQINNNYSIV